LENEETEEKEGNEVKKNGKEGCRRVARRDGGRGEEGMSKG
jgi:hypothetical protein